MIDVVAKTYRTTLVRRVGNVAISGAVKLGIAPSYYVLLSIRGRRSGVERTIPIRLMRHDGQEWFVAPYGVRDWVHNARAAGEAVVRRGRRSRRVRLTEVFAAVAAPVLAAYARKEPVTRPFFDARVGDPVSAFEAEADRHPVFRVENLQVNGGAGA
ncbi:deazaflavin-dependent oxidoreductase (nitroreductase family) [Lentzea atacamensis]|uniref:Deazaflavin-dependent oxidoreductase (Nitroreductase family) n=1 Tax=Lentzea atacamensis TaxID=531938 RepID=A0ABX9E066_9PSEU|nr:nitroreductase/quinone reductase family protein [Lentzea atacamensis]RAS59977.1 deazaflavin-dependent oxidoreductase (nitroreductase family) [Lentzea atacamensis]